MNTPWLPIDSAPRGRTVEGRRGNAVHPTWKTHGKVGWTFRDDRGLQTWWPTEWRELPTTSVGIADVLDREANHGR